MTEPAEERCPQCEGLTPQMIVTDDMLGDLQVCTHPWHSAKVAPERTPESQLGPNVVHTPINWAVAPVKAIAQGDYRAGCHCCQSVAGKWDSTTCKIHKGKPLKCKPLKDGEWETPRRKGYRLQCCDCGLIHVMDFRLVKYSGGRAIQFRAYRADKYGVAGRKGE